MTTPAKDPQALPCPFCGRAPSVTTRPDNIGGTEFFAAVVCYCGGYSACAHKMAVRKTQGDASDAAFKAWNTRTARPASMEAQKLGEQVEPALGNENLSQDEYESATSALGKLVAMASTSSEADARRYRWLRNESWSCAHGRGKYPRVCETIVFTQDGAGNVKTILAEEAMDAAIDAALAQQAEPGESNG